MANDRPILEILAELDATKTQKNIQAQLDKMSKELKVGFSTSSRNGKDGVDLETRAMKAYTVEIAKATHAYKTGEKGVVEYNNQLKTLIDSKKYENLSWQKQEQLVAEYTRTLKILASNQDSVDKKRVAASKAIEAQLIDENKLETEKLMLLQKIEKMKISSPKAFATSNVQGLATNAQTAVMGMTAGNVATLDKAKVAMGELSNGVLKVNKSLAGATTTGKGFFGMLKADLGKVVQWMGAMTIFYGTLRTIQSGIKYVMELDNALNEIRIVTGQTQEQVEGLAKTYGELAVSMSVTTDEVVKQAADLYRQGLSAKEVEDRMKSIITYSKISGLAMDESNKIITATANATGESAQKIVDIFSYLGDQTASGADEIGLALEAVASSATGAGLSIERISAYIATVSSVTRQSASTIGRSLNSVLARYQSIKENGFNDEDATKLNNVTKALHSVGIEATGADGQLRNFGEVMDELAPKFKTLEVNERNYIATTMFGTFQMNRGIALLDNYDNALGNMKMAYDSAGQAQAKFNIYQESTQAHLDKMTASWQNLGKSLIDSELIKTLIDIGTLLADFAVQIVVVVGAIAGFLKIEKLLSAGVASSSVNFTKMAVAIKGVGIAAGIASVAFVAAFAVFVTSVLKAIQADKDLRESLEETNKAYRLYLSDPNEENFQNFKNQSEKRIALLQKELDKLNEVKDFYNTIGELKPKVGKDTFKKLFSPENINGLFDGMGIGGIWGNIFNRGSKLGDVNKTIFSAMFPSVDSLIKKTEESIKVISDTIEHAPTPDIIAAKSKGTILPNSPIVVKTADDIANAFEAEQNAAKELDITLKDLDSEYKQQVSSVTKYQSEMKSMVDLYDKINDGGKISNENLIELLLQYPEYNSQIMSSIGNKESELSLTELIFEANKQKAIAEQQAAIENIKTQIILNELNIDAFNLSKQQIKQASLFMSEKDPQRKAMESYLNSDASKMAQGFINEIEARTSSIGILKKLKMSDFNIDDKKPKATKPYQLPDSVKNDIAKLDNAIAASEKKGEEAQIKALKAKEDYLQKIHDEITDTATRTELEGNIIDLQNKQIDLKEEINKINQTTIDNLKKGEEDLIDLNKKLEDSENDRAKAIADSVVKQIEDAKYDLEWEEKDKTDILDQKIASNDILIASLERQNDELKEQEERQKRLNDILDERNKLSNILKEKNTKILNTNGQWEWVANPKDVRESQEKIKTLTDDMDEWERENARQKKINNIKYQNDALNIQKDNLKRFYDAQYSIMDNAIRNINAIDAYGYEERMKLLRKFVGDYQLEISKIAAISIPAVGNISASGGGANIETATNEVTASQTQKDNASGIIEAAKEQWANANKIYQSATTQAQKDAARAQMDKAHEIAESARKYVDPSYKGSGDGSGFTTVLRDSGGVMPNKSSSLNLSGKPELALNNAQVGKVFNLLKATPLSPLNSKSSNSSVSSNGMSFSGPITVIANNVDEFASGLRRQVNLTHK